MQGLFGKDWVAGLPDEHRASDEYRIQPLAVLELERLDDVYFVRATSWRTVWNYLLEIGITGVLRKIRSRSQEGLRNQKFVTCGLGRVLEAPDGGLAPGTPVQFLAPLSPACADRLVLPAPLVTKHVGPLPELLQDGNVLHLPVAERVAEEKFWAAQRGWTRYSGIDLDEHASAMVLKDAGRVLAQSDWSEAQSHPCDSTAPTCEIIARTQPADAGDKPRASLFGYGNFAKTVILPTITRHLSVERVHEIDPSQIPFRKPGKVEWDTSPELREDERPDVVVLAGYHHTHAPLAIEALRRGSVAVIEKPAATNRLQLRQLLATLEETGGRAFLSFQRRYLECNERIFDDLGVEPGEAIHYHCVVYEVPLPELHWYRWPNSRTRLVSNGCHWIDQFLFLNQWSPPTSHEVTAGPDGTLNCSVALENGAFFTMVLTERGSSRLGVQDHVELRSGDVTAKIENGAEYEVQDGEKILFRHRGNRLDAYQRMYDEIGRRVANNEDGDSLESIRATASLVLALEDDLERSSVWTAMELLDEHLERGEATDDLENRFHADTFAA